MIFLFLSNKFEINSNIQTCASTGQLLNLMPHRPGRARKDDRSTLSASEWLSNFDVHMSRVYELF